MPEIGIYYYPWYNKLQWTKHQTKHTPRIGFYDSSDPILLHHHAEMLAKLGVDYVVIETLPIDDWNAEFSLGAAVQLAGLLSAYGVKFCLFLDFLVGDIHQDILIRLENLLVQIERHDIVPTKLRNGLPLLMFFGTLTQGGYRIKEYLKDRYSVLCADFIYDWNLKIGDHNKVFVAWNMPWRTIPLPFFKELGWEFTDDDLVRVLYDALPFCQFWSATRDMRCMQGVCGVIPGYDDRLLGRPQHNTPVVLRKNGQTLVEQFTAAIAMEADDIIIYSWNEYFEASTIEPTIEYGEFYYRLTHELIQQSKEGVPIHMPENMDFGEQPVPPMYLTKKLAVQALKEPGGVPMWGRFDYCATVHTDGISHNTKGQILFPAVHVKNSGEKLWPIITEKAQIYLGVRLQDSNEEVVYEGRTPLGMTDILPGMEVQSDLILKIEMLSPGEYLACLGVVWENRFWMELLPPIEPIRIYIESK
jgi:hypothetical protein